MCSTCRKFTSTRWLLLGVLLLAVIAFTGQVANAAVCAGTELVSASGGLSLGQPGGIHMGNSYTTGLATITNTSTCDGVGENVTMNAAVTLVPACTVVPLPGTTCGSPDSGVITVTSATSAIGECGGNAAAITWTVSGGPGTFTLTDPNGNIPLAAAGLCTIHFSYTVNTLPTVDAKPSTATVIDTGGSVAASVIADSQDSAGGVGTTSTPFTFTCAVKVDKQISCDGGVTWNDMGEQSANGDGNQGCIGLVGDNDIKVRYFAQNISDSGITLNTCSISESNTNLGSGVAGPISIGNNGVGGGASTTETSELGLSPSALLCETAHPGEADTAGVSCTCNIPALGPNAPVVTASDGANFECCGVKVDKQVTCDGGTTWVDQGEQTANGDGTNSCNALFGQTVGIRYFAQNTGTLPLTCSTGNSQGLQDTYVVNSGVALALTSETIAVSTEIGPIANPNVTTCDATLQTNESLGNKATIDCTCAGSASLGSDVAVSAFDQARINCQNAVFTTSKTCVPTTPGGTTFDATVTVNNTGDVQLSCAVVDQYVAGACGSLPTCPLAGGTAVTLSPDPVVVAASASGSETGQFSSQATVCNQACITCTPSGGSALPPQAAIATCPVSTGCFTRTPGYWGTHPAVTQQLLPLTVCGISLTQTLAGSLPSATQDLCESGKDFKNNSTSPQQLQLIRQCTAAALNLAASAEANLGCEAADPGITVDFNNCCVGTDSVCDSGKTPKQINDSGCIGILDAFNNQFETTDFPSFLNLGNHKADPSQCQVSNGDGVVNPGRNLGPAK